MSDSAHKAHAIHTTVRQLLDLQDDTELITALSLLSDDQRWKVDRVFEVTRTVDNRLANTPATLTSSASLNSINNLLQQAFAELSNFRKNKNPGHISNADSHAEGVIPQLAGFAALPLQSGDDGLAQLISDLRARASGVAKAISEEKVALSKQVGELSSRVDAQAEKIDELSALIEAQKKEAVAVSAEVKSEYNKTESELRSEFEESLRAMKEEFGTLKSTTQESAELSLAELKRHENEAKQIVQVVGNVGVTGNYQKIALSEGRAANNWRLVTIVFFGLGIALAVIVLLSHLFPEVKIAFLTYLFPEARIERQPASGWELIMRLLTAVAVTTPAFYTARESARHRTNSDRARQKELELASLGPFIELLPQEKKNEIVEKMTGRYFGHDIAPHEIKTAVDTNELATALKKAIKP